MYYFSLYVEFVKIQIRRAVEYRLATLMEGLSQIAGYSAEFVVIWIMIQKFEAIGGWNPYEVMLLYAFALFTYAFSSLFLYTICWDMSEYVRTGTLDEVLTKPTNPFAYLCCNGFEQGYWAHFIVAISIMVMCFGKLGISFTFGKTIWLIVTLLGGSLIQGALNLIASIPAFWTTNNTSLQNIKWGAYEFVRYPINIYNKFVQVFLTLVVPYAFVNFYPAQYFLSKTDYNMFGPAMQYLTPVVGIALASLAYFLWLQGLKHYKSTGS